MAAGDISDIMLANLRILIDESSAGFWTDNQLFTLLSSAQRKCILLLLGKKRGMEKIDPYYMPDGLESAVKKASAISTSSANSYSISAITDLIEVIEVELINTSPARTLKTTYIPISKQLMYQRNTYTQHQYDTTSKSGQIYTSVYGTTLQTSFATSSFPNSDYGQISITYIYSPPDLTTSVDPILRVETYEAITYFALSDALVKDGRTQEAQIFYNQALNILWH